MRVCSLRRLPGSNWAKAMRDMRSPPKTACGLRLDTEASCSPEASSIRVVTTLVVPTSMARPNLRSARVARLDGEDAAAEGGDGDLAVVLAEGRGQGLQHVGRHVLDGAADGGEQRLEVRGLVVLVLRQA